MKRSSAFVLVLLLGAFSCHHAQAQPPRTPAEAEIALGSLQAELTDDVYNLFKHDVDTRKHNPLGPLPSEIRGALAVAVSDSDLAQTGRDSGCKGVTYQGAWEREDSSGYGNYLVAIDHAKAKGDASVVGWYGSFPQGLNVTNNQFINADTMPAMWVIVVGYGCPGSPFTHKSDVTYDVFGDG